MTTRHTKNRWWTGRADWLEQHRVVFAGHEAEVAARLVRLAQEALIPAEGQDAAPT